MKAFHSRFLASRGLLGSVVATGLTLMSATAWGSGLAGDEVHGSLILPWAPEAGNWFSIGTNESPISSLPSAAIVGLGAEFEYCPSQASTAIWSVTADLSDDQITINERFSDSNPGSGWWVRMTSWTLTLSGLDWAGAPGIASATVVSQDPHISLLGFDAHSVQFHLDEVELYPSGPYSYSRTTLIQLAAVPELSGAPAVSYLVGNVSGSIDRQTGLFFQQVVVTNISTNILTGLRVSVTNLPTAVQLVSATSTNPINGAPFVEITNSLAPGQALTLTLAYYSATREAPASTGVSVEAVTPSPTAPDSGDAVTLRRAFFRADGYVAVEFDSLSSRRYGIQYSTDLSLWAQAQPVVPGNGGRMIWVDTGPPVTASLPSTNRFYRIVLLPE